MFYIHYALLNKKVIRHFRNIIKYYLFSLLLKCFKKYKIIIYVEHMGDGYAQHRGNSINK